MQFIDPAHQGQIPWRDRTWQIIDAAPANIEHPCLLGHGQIMIAINHRFALSRPALLSAPSKKSFSSVSWPILACRVFKIGRASCRERGWVSLGEVDCR